MRIVAYGLLVSAVLSIFSVTSTAAQIPVLLGDSVVPLSGSEVLPHAIQGGALAVLAFTVWFLLARAWPAQTAAMKEQRESFLEVIQTERRELQEERREMRTFIESLVTKFTGVTVGTDPK